MSIRCDEINPGLWCPPRTVRPDVARFCPPPRRVEPLCPPAFDCFDPCRPLFPVRFSTYLEEENIEARAAAARLDRCPTPPCCRIAITESASANQAPARPSAARIGDVPPPSRTTTDRKLLVTYRVQIPTHPGRVIDVFA